MFVLAIDTSSAAVTAGVVVVDARSVRAIAEHSRSGARSHGEFLAPGIAGCLSEAGLRPADIDAVVAGVGPGPFTGLRVGLVTASTFAHAVGCPAYGVCSLDAIAAAAADEAQLLVVTDARRREVYWARYRQGRRLGQLDVAGPTAVPLDGVTAIAGSAAEQYSEVWPHLTLRPERYPDPVALVEQAAERVRSQAPADPLAPLYLRRPDAVVPGAPKSVTR